MQENSFLDPFLAIVLLIKGRDFNYNYLTESLIYFLFFYFSWSISHKTLRSTERFELLFSNQLIIGLVSIEGILLLANASLTEPFIISSFITI